MVKICSLADHIRKTVKVERNFHSGGLCCNFQFEGRTFFADLCLVPFADYTECMIFATEDGQLTLNTARELYCKRDIPVTEDSLLECVQEFIETYKPGKKDK